MTGIASDVLEQLTQLLGQKGVRQGEDELLPEYILKPASTDQVAGILEICSAAGQELLLPLDFGARGSATLGGTVATNAGGNMVIRYGMMRETVLGMEAVLASDAILPQSQLERNAVWEIHDEVLDLFYLGPLIPFDISVTIDRMEAFVADLLATLKKTLDPQNILNPGKILSADTIAAA